MLSKESKIRVLENFYALDYVFFGKNVGQVENCCPLVKEEYLSIKGALLSVFVEMLKLVDHTPDIVEERVKSKILLQNARTSAKTARENAQRIVSTSKSRANIKESLKKMIKEDKDLDISAVIESQIRQKAFSLAVDNLLLARVVSESTGFDKLNEWEGTIIEDSYKILRDNLIESAYELLYEEDVDVPDEDEDEKKKVAKEPVEEGWKLGALIGFFTPIPGGTIAGGFIGHWLQQNKVKVAAYCKSKAKVGSPEHAECIAGGMKAMKAKAVAMQARVKK